MGKQRTTKEGWGGKTTFSKLSSVSSVTQLCPTLRPHELQDARLPWWWTGKPGILHKLKSIESAMPSSHLILCRPLLLLPLIYPSPHLFLWGSPILSSPWHVSRQLQECAQGFCTELGGDVSVSRGGALVPTSGRCNRLDLALLKSCLPWSWWRRVRTQIWPALYLKFPKPQ